jgi:predicted RNA-binding protein (virulence factor B family)
MAELGHYNKLRVIKRADIGVFLDGDQFGDILLPRKYAPESMRIGDEVEVFLYNDSEDRIIATTLQPKTQVGECAYLKVVSTNRFGAFLDWGLPKDLLVPFSEQQNPMQQGYSYSVTVFVDEETQRIAASTKLEQHLSVDVSSFKPRQEVDLLIYGKSDLGFKAIINGTHLGQLFEGETFQRLHFGEQVKGYIRQVRGDGKIDLMLQLPSELTRDNLGKSIIDHLRQHDGVSTLTDKSPPDDIYQAFGVSKASYKKALGQLYKNRRILIEKHKITLV